MNGELEALQPQAFEMETPTICGIHSDVSLNFIHQICVFLVFL